MSNQNQQFSEEVALAVGNYVYRLIDPRNGETFYIGKGKGNRLFNHVNAVKIDDTDEDEQSLKTSRIKAIMNTGLNVIHVIHRHEIPDAAIYEVEAALIDAFSGLSNSQGGHGSGSKGPMSAVEIIDKYSLPKILDAPEERLVLFNINRLEDRSDRQAILRQTQFAWRISEDKAKKADYVLAVVRGVVVGAFIADEWLAGTHDNFPEHTSINDQSSNRFGFKGRIAPDPIWQKFVGERGKRIEIEGMKHVQNPVRYWKI